MTVARRLLGLMLILLLSASCSSTTKVSDSWSSQYYQGQIKNVYIIGIAKSDMNRMMFEDTFKDRLVAEGVKALPSYIDLPRNEEAEREAIIQKMTTNNCDSVLLTRVVRQKKTATIGSDRGSYTYSPGPGYASGPAFHRLPKDAPFYNNWGSYYNYGRLNYVPPSSVDFVILTVESVLYDLKTEELIWSAQLETRLKGNIEEMMRIFVDEVVKDLREKGLL